MNRPTTRSGARIHRCRRGTLRTAVLGVMLGTASALFATAAVADTWPSRPVRIMVGASPGGGTDLIARMLAEKFAAGLKAQFVVENRPGASNTIAADLTAKATADGTTLLVATNTGQAIAPHLLKLAFDPLKDLQPVGLIVSVPNVLVAGPALGTRTLDEIVRTMKDAPGSLRYASSGVGSTQHLAGEGFDLVAGTRATHVPYKGSSQAHLDLIGGQVELMFDTTSSAMAHIKSGKLRPLAVLSAERSAQLPDVPTLKEAGFPGFEMSTWYGLFVTGGTPPAVVDALAAELRRVLALPDVRSRLEALGGTPGTLTAGEFAAFNRAEFERFGRLIKDAKVSVGK